MTFIVRPGMGRTAEGSLSRITIIVWMLVAIGLTVGAYFSTRYGASGDPEVLRAAVFDVSASGISVIGFKRGPEIVRVEAAGESGWELVSGTGAAESRWPVNLENVQSALRQLATLTGEPLPGSEDVGAGNQVWLETTAGQRWELTAGAAQLGGTTLVRVRDPAGEEQVYRVEAGLIDALLKSGPDPWRDTAVFRQLARVSQITLRSGREVTQLVRSGEKWSVLDPSAPADTRAVERLLQAISQIRVHRFEVGTPGEVADPLASIEVTYVVRSAEGGESTRVVQRLDVGALDDLSQKTVRAVYARVQLKGAGSTPVSTNLAEIVISREPLDPIRPNPLVYVSPFPLRTPASGIGALVLEREGGRGRLGRTASGWSAGEGPAQAPLNEASANSVGELLRSATTVPATWVWRRENAPQASVIASVTVESLTGAPLERLEMVLVRDPEESGGTTVSVGFATEAVVWAMAPGASLDAARAVVEACGLEWIEQ